MLPRAFPKCVSSRFLLGFCLPRVEKRVQNTFLPSQTFLPHGVDEDLERMAVLEAKVEEARKRRHQSLYQRAAPVVERLDSSGNLMCTKCRVFKTVDLFFVDSSSKYGHTSACKVCHAEYTSHYYGFTLRGLMTGILNNAKTHAAKRLKNSREEAGRFELNLDSLLNLWLEQKGRCAYSDVIMNIEPWTPWRISIERRDNTAGYVAGNVVFVCAEFNTQDSSVNAKRGVSGSSQWSRHKVQWLPTKIWSSIPIENITRNKIISELRPAPRARKTVLNETVSSCVTCGELKLIEHFYRRYDRPTGIYRSCKACKLAQMHDYHNSPIGFLTARMHFAKAAAKKRSKLGRHAAGEFDLTIDDIIMIYNRQRGLCYYGGLKMVLQPLNDWMCSIERLDNSKGYVLDNVVLICGEFQTSDHSSRAKVPIKGTPQWSKDKVSMLVQWLKFTKVVSRQTRGTG
eukprot:GEMP01021253.1.p1 GENE.GEMP01021253.1~~GEMP01021253.1.p1  ORF type:complete len:456 (+),score=24.05 GEMP01021253.1:86-1453(+)